MAVTQWLEQRVRSHMSKTDISSVSLFPIHESDGTALKSNFITAKLLHLPLIVRIQINVS